MDTTNVSKPIWEMSSAECEEVAFALGYMLRQRISACGQDIQAKRADTGEEALLVTGMRDEPGRRIAVATLAYRAGRFRLVDKRACVYLGPLSEPTAEEPGPGKPAPPLGWSQPIDGMCDMDVTRAARLIGMDVLTFSRGRYHIAAWGPRGGDLSAEGPPLEYIDALRLALTNAASDACRFDWPTGRVWLGPLPMPPAEPEKEPAPAQDVGQPEPAAPKPVTCACGRCEWSPKRLCWIITGSCATIPVGVFCEVCGSYLASGVSIAAMQNREVADGE